MSELLPCPFCGSKQTIRRHNEHVLLTASNHKRGCIMRELLPFVAFSTEAEAIAAWNTRSEYHGYEQAAIEAWESIKKWNTRAERTCRSTTDDNAWCFVCSECEKSFPRSQLHLAHNHGEINYCPNCGARVVGE